MAINRNLNFDIGGIGRVGGAGLPPSPKGAAPLPPGDTTTANEGAAPPTPARPAATPQTPMQRAAIGGIQSLTRPGPSVAQAQIPAPQMTFNPGIVLTPGLIAPGIFIAPHDKTTTQIAQAAVTQLTGAAAAVLSEAVSTIKAKNVAADDLLNYLERKTRVGEVLNELATDWSAQTKQDFADAFQMAATPDKLPVMDSIVSISILNDPELRGELQVENTTEASSADLMENRRIVWQWPEPGTPFTPPYLLMVAVERQDTTQAQNVIQSILGNLVEFQGYKLPRAASQKVGGPTVSSQVLTANLAATTLRRGK
jgi:hypothetical protein